MKVFSVFIFGIIVSSLLLQFSCSKKTLYKDFHYNSPVYQGVLEKQYQQKILDIVEGARRLEPNKIPLFDTKSLLQFSYFEGDRKIILSCFRYKSPKTDVTAIEILTGDIKEFYVSDESLQHQIDLLKEAVESEKNSQQ